MEENELIRPCSFCGKTRPVIQSFLRKTKKKTYICHECAAICFQIFEEESGVSAAPEVADKKTGQKNRVVSQLVDFPPKPRDIEKMLDESLIGQEGAKRAISVAAYYHYAEVKSALARSGTTNLNEFTRKNNTLLIGPPGSGKTYMAETLAFRLGLPFVSEDASALTDTGYVGRSVSDMLGKLIARCQYDFNKAMIGMIYIDEIDKLAKPSMSFWRDVSGEGVQHELLRLLSGEDFTFTDSNRQQFIFPTKMIFLVCGGAFQGLDAIIRNRICEGGIGFGAKLREQQNNGGKKVLQDVTPGDLEKYGFILELIRRFHNIVAFNELSEDDLYRILTEPVNAPVKWYERVAKNEKTELCFTEGALRAIAHLAKEQGTGASGLDAILNIKLRRTLRALPSWRGKFPRVEVTKEVIVDPTNTAKPIRFVRDPKTGELVPSDDQ